ncbi:hypothetical protein JB92DRAFT_3109208 [Gautieria morchelliformis]|nr:hypothetical protein JB92DRAFT_3109208 [Gautieria morchelliformis]
MAAGEKAGDWWTEMGGKIDTSKWRAVRAAFVARWLIPMKNTHKKEQTKYELATLHLTLEEIGTTVEFRGRMVPAHIAFSGKALVLVQAIEDPTGLLVEDTRRTLPNAARKFIANETYDAWQEFHDGMTAIRIPALEEATREAETGERLKRIEQALSLGWGMAEQLEHADNPQNSDPNQSEDAGHATDPSHFPTQQMLGAFMLLHQNQA